MRAAVMGLLLLGSLAACGGGGSDQPATGTSSTTPGAAPTAGATVATPRGTPAQEALMRFRCEKATGGAWNASGYLVNGGKTKVGYQVTVYVGDAAGATERAKTKQVPAVAAGGSVGFQVRRIPAPASGGTCHVQVLATG